MKRLAIVTTHPIQYNVPLFKTLTKRGIIEINVFYTWSQSQNGFFDVEFNKRIKWDTPLLEGYSFDFVTNVSNRPNSKHFRGIVCPDLISKIETWKPDAILVYGWAFHAHLQTLKHFKGKVPILFRGDSTLLDEKFGARKIFRRILLKYVYSFVDFAFFVGTHNIDYFIKNGLKESQLIYLPYTIDGHHFKDDEQGTYKRKAAKIRKELGIKPEDKVVAFIGKFIKKKNPLFILKAIVRYNLQNKTKIKLLFIGSGKQEKMLKKRSKNDKNIFFIPFVNQKDIPIAYRIADIFALPSKGPQETWGVSVNEALVCKRFVIVSNKVGSAIDLIKNNKNGEIFESNNIEDFIYKLKKLVNKEHFTTEIDKNLFSLDNAAETIEKLIYQQ